MKVSTAAIEFEQFLSGPSFCNGGNEYTSRLAVSAVLSNVRAR